MILFLIGRVLFGGYFIYSGIKHFTGLEGMSGYAASKGVPMPKLSVAVTGLMLLFGGLTLFLGVWVPVGVWVLIVFLLSTLVKMHTFWKVMDPMQRMAEQIQFSKNVAMIGALLMVLAIPLPWVYGLMF